MGPSKDNQPLPLPTSRGPMSAFLLGLMTSDAEPRTADPIEDLCAAGVDPLSDEDFQLSLFVLYELHYRGITGVDDRWEWSPHLLDLRARLEHRFEKAITDRLGPAAEVSTVADVEQALAEMTTPNPRSPLTSFIARRAEQHHVRELLTHRSVYHLKEADPHTWAIPRLHGKPKAALVEIQADEYGGGRVEWVHATMFARAMRGAGLDDTYGALIDVVPGVSLAVVNAMSLFGLHRRHRGACIGHLTAFEMTSTHPNRRYAQGLRRLNYDPDVTAYFDEHVEADAIHEQIACHDMAGGLLEQDFSLAPDVLLGARAALLLDDLVAEHLLTHWGEGASSLLRVPDDGSWAQRRSA